MTPIAYACVLSTTVSTFALALTLIAMMRMLTHASPRDKAREAAEQRAAYRYATEASYDTSAGLGNGHGRGHPPGTGSFGFAP